MRGMSEERVGPDLRTDSIWRMEAYRLALAAADAAWDDVTLLAKDRRTRDVAPQLFRALGSVHANLAEGYSRRSDRGCARFLEYTLGSVREAMGWYHQARHLLGLPIINERHARLLQVRRLVLTMLADRRRRCEGRKG